MRKILLSVLLMFAVHITQADVFKCPGNNGRMIFQDRPCEGGAGATVDVLQQKRPESNRDTHVDNRKICAGSGVKIGMSPKEVTVTWGNPDKQSSEVGSSGQVMTWIFHCYRSNYDTDAEWRLNMMRNAIKEKDIPSYSPSNISPKDSRVLNKSILEGNRVIRIENDRVIAIEWEGNH